MFRRRRAAWIVAAIVLLLGATLLLSTVEDDPTPTAREAVAFPRAMRDHEWKRREQRSTLVLPAPAPAPGEDARPAKRDPFLVALPAGPDVPVVVLEANALRHSKLGELFVSCILARDPEAFAEIQRETGVDVLKDVDRVGFAGESLVMSGFFDQARWDRLEADPAVAASSYGDAGRVFVSKDGGAMGAWGNGLILYGPDEAAVRRSIDQLEGRAPSAESPIPEDLAYGEIYGVLPAAAARRLVPGDPALAERLAAIASRIELHVDAMQDVAAVVRVQGDDAQGMDDLSRSLGAALTAARLEANAVADHRMRELLDFARVVRDDGRFSLELALPADRLEAWFSDCRPLDGGDARAPAREPPEG